MKVVLATDGSPCSDTAVELMAGLRWPEGTTVRIVTALDTVRLAGPWATMVGYGLDDLERTLLDELERTIEEAARRLLPTGATLERQVLLGRPSAVIVEEAASMGADLIVVGSRGQGPIRTLLLGSVSAEVVDHAPCPVLVVRGPTISRALLAHDGSDLARAAEDLLRTLPPFARLPVEVLSVVRTREPGAETLAPTTLGSSMSAYHEAVEEARHHHEDVARAAAERLGRGGREVTWTVRAGDAARGIVEETGARGADLVVMGTHGRTGLDRLVLGSVARNVLTHAHCSVLVVRGMRAVVDRDAPVTPGRAD